MKIVFDGRELTPVVALPDETVCPVESCKLLFVTDEEYESLAAERRTVPALQFDLMSCVRFLYDGTNTGDNMVCTNAPVC